MTYTVELTTDGAVWGSLLAGSPQDNVFCSTAFLDSAGLPYDLWTVCEDGTPWLGAIIAKDDQGLPLAAPRTFSLYQGLVFSRQHSELPPHRRAKIGLDLVEALLSACADNYPRFAFSIHHAVEDLRGLQWFNYHTPEKGRVSLHLNYTGVIALQETSSFTDYLGSIRQVKQQEYRKAALLGADVGTAAEIDLLAQLHRQTLERQGLTYDDAQEDLLRNISHGALKNGYGELLLCRAANGDVAAATLFLRDERSAYYLFGANHPEHRKTGAGTFLTLESVRRAFDRNLRSVDMVGINSPNRGDFKTSLNARPVPYFTGSWARPQLERRHARAEAPKRF